MLLRETRERDTEQVVDRLRSDAVTALGVLATVAVFLLALNVVAHGFITPGGGFQGGVVLAAAAVLVFLGIEYRAFDVLTQQTISEPIEGFGAGAFVAVGLGALAVGAAFLENVLGAGRFGRLTSGGSAILVNWASALAVAGGFLVIFSEYLQQAEAERYGRRRSP
jgi:multicomponent Na+:H+ antiporter subunit B